MCYDIENYDTKKREIDSLIKASSQLKCNNLLIITNDYEAEEKAYHYARKSIVATMDIPAGTAVERHMLTCKRPGTGIYPRYLDAVVGRRANLDIEKDTTISWEMICNEKNESDF